MLFKKRKQIERICKNCKIFDPKTGVCKIVVLYEGKRINVPMDENDSCMYETGYFDPFSNNIEDFSEDIKEVKFWVEDEKGNKTDKDGTVKIEYPEGFFGDNDPNVEELDEEYKKFLKELDDDLNPN